MLETAAQILEKVAVVTQDCTGNNINSYTLEGQGRVSSQVDFCTGLFPLDGPSARMLLTVTNRDIPTEYRQISGLTIPARIAAFNMPDIPNLSNLLERRLATSELPSVLLTRGIQEAGERATVLWAVQGMSPQRALAELKRAILDQLSRQN